MPDFSFLSGLNILVRRGVGGFTVIILQVSVQIGLNLTGLELSLAINNKLLPLWKAMCSCFISIDI